MAQLRPEPRAKLQNAYIRIKDADYHLDLCVRWARYSLKALGGKNATDAAIWECISKETYKVNQLHEELLDALVNFKASFTALSRSEQQLVAEANDCMLLAFKSFASGRNNWINGWFAIVGSYVMPEPVNTLIGEHDHG